MRNSLGSREKRVMRERSRSQPAVEEVGGEREINRKDGTSFGRGGVDEGVTGWRL